MNDFTKDELEDLQSMCDVCDNPLMFKIQDMIDTYCEHEWEFYISLHGNAVTCNKCHRGISENK